MSNLIDKTKAFLNALLSAPVRKAIYGLVAAGFAFAFALGFDGDQAIFTTALDNAYQLLTALAAIMALVKVSDPEPTESTLDALIGLAHNHGVSLSSATTDEDAVAALIAYKPKVTRKTA